VALDGHSATGSRLGVHQFSRSAAAEPSTCQTRNRFRAWPIAVRHPHNHVTCNAQTDRRLTSTLLRSRSDLSIPLEVGVRVGVPGSESTRCSPGRTRQRSRRGRRRPGRPPQPAPTAAPFPPARPDHSWGNNHGGISEHSCGPWPIVNSISISHTPMPNPIRLQGSGRQSTHFEQSGR